MKRRLLVVGLVTILCLSGCSRDMEPMVEDEVGQSEITLSDEQMGFLAKGLELIRKYPCVTGPVLPSRIMSPLQ